MRLPIRLRLTAAFAAVLAVVLVGAGVIVYSRVRNNADRTIDAELRARARTLLAGPSGVVPSVGFLGLSDERFGQVLDGGGRVVAGSAQLTSRPMVRDADPGLRIATARTRAERRRVRLLVVRDGGRTLLLATALDDHDEALAELRASLLGGAAVTFAVACGLAWLLASAALRPVERLRRAADAYSATDLTRRLDEPPTDDEIRRLAVTLNAMLDRIQGSFERQRSFVDRASHELRTPLANLSLELELALRSDGTTAELRTALDSAAEEAARLDALASNLLVLARTTDGVLPVARTSVDLAALLDDTVAGFASRAAVAGVTVSVAAEPDPPVSVDPLRVRQAVTNLVDNALRATPPGGSVVVSSARGTGSDVVIRVCDTGPGFDPDVATTAFGAFVRGRTAASIDGAGLGLAIVAAVAEAHGGTVAITPADPGPGACVTLVLAAGST